MEKIGKPKKLTQFCRMASIEKNRFLVHFLMWGGAWSLLIIYINYSIGANPRGLIFRGIPTLVGIFLILFFNLKILLPKLYFKKRIGAYILISLVLFIILIWLLNNHFFLFSNLSTNYSHPSSSFNPEGNFRNLNRRPAFVAWLRFIPPLLITFVGSTLVELTRFANRKEKEVIYIEKEKLDTEIKFLKSQINPHFLFNVLNNIYTLTVIKSDKASENLLRLSDILRYMLYDANSKKVPLKKELSYIEDYINLASLKDSRGLNIKVDLDKSQPNLPVAPLLFIPFVENAFKHSKIEDLKKGFIELTLKTKPKQLIFIIKNSIPEDGFKKDKVGGIGLTNTKQRLALLYPDQHQLKIEEDKDVFSVSLKLDIK